MTTEQDYLRRDGESPDEHAERINELFAVSIAADVQQLRDSGCPFTADYVAFAFKDSPPGGDAYPKGLYEWLRSIPSSKLATIIMVLSTPAEEAAEELGMPPAISKIMIEMLTEDLLHTALRGYTIENRVGEVSMSEEEVTGTVRKLFYWALTVHCIEEGWILEEAGAVPPTFLNEESESDYRFSTVPGFKEDMAERFPDLDIENLDDIGGPTTGADGPV